MRRDHISLFDGDAVDADDITREFWGGTRGWGVHERRDDAAHEPMHAPEHPSGVQQIWRDEPTGALRAVREGLAAFRPRTRPDHTGPVARTRRHGAVSRPTYDAERSTREATLAELAAGRPHRLDPAGFDGDIDDYIDDHIDGVDAGVVGFGEIDPQDDLVPLTPAPTLGARLGLEAVDPLIVRIGIVIAALVLLVPLALALRDGDAGAIVTETSVDASTDQPAVVPAAVTPDEAGAGQAVGVAPAPDPATPGQAAPATPAPPAVVESAGAPAEQVAASTPSPEQTTTPVSDETASAADTGSAVVDERADVQADGVATADAVAERIVPDCSLTYMAAPGDSWYRIADAAGISPTALLSQNRATVETVILPGDDVCLPAGATVPSPPATTAPATTAPATTGPATTAAPVTTAPATTAAPAGTVAPASRSEVQQLIRDIWPDELEERALQIAWRESGFVATAHNGWCCYGVFQLYWSVHRSWLDDYGVLSATDLYDARKNVTAAYALYQRSGGWGAWGG